MKIKISELNSRQLDWTVTKLELDHLVATGEHIKPWVRDAVLAGESVSAYSSDWLFGGPIVEREGIALWLSTTPEKGKWASADHRWMDLDPDSDEFLAMPDPWHGSTPLVAAMRSYVASRLGDEVDVPETLL